MTVNSSAMSRKPKRAKGARTPEDGAELKIDRLAHEIALALDNRGKVYRKIGQVRAKPASTTTLVETVLSDGTRETTNRAQPGDFIVTGTGGEKYVIKRETFFTRYEPKPGTKTIYTARGFVVAVPNPYNRPIAINASWGEVQHGAADCMIADIFDAASGQRAGQPYIIGRAEFGKTYASI
jgi:PGDYG protein